MSKEFSPDHYFPNSSDFANPRFYAQNLKDFNIETSLTKIYARELEKKPSVILPERSDQLFERLPEIVQQLHSCKPLCLSKDQRELARQALTALKNRKLEDIKNVTKRLAGDVAGAVD